MGLLTQHGGAQSSQMPPGFQLCCILCSLARIFPCWLLGAPTQGNAFEGMKQNSYGGSLALIVRSCTSTVTPQASNWEILVWGKASPHIGYTYYMLQGTMQFCNAISQCGLRWYLRSYVPQRAPDYQLSEWQLQWIPGQPPRALLPLALRLTP